MDLLRKPASVELPFVGFHALVLGIIIPDTQFVVIIDVPVDTG